MAQVTCCRCGIPLSFTVQDRRRFTLHYDRNFMIGCQDMAQKLKDAGGAAVNVEGCDDAARSVSAWLDHHRR